MTVDGFLTFLSLLIAAAALASSGTRMRMSLLWGLPALSGILAFLLVIYLQLFDRFGVQCPDFMGQGCEVLTLDQHTVTAQELSFFIVIAWLVLALGLSARRRISIKGLPKLEKLVGRLLSDKQFSQAADLIEPNLELIIDVISNKTRVQRLRRYFETRRPDTLAVLAFLQHEEGQKVRTQWDRILSPLQHLLPGIEKQREAALSLYHQVTASNEFIEYAALARLSLGLKLMTAQIWKSEEYTEKFFDALMSEKDSAFYADQMQRMPPRQKSEDYGVHTPLYSFLFNDAHVAKNLDIYRYPGEYVIRELSPDRDAEYIEWLNSPPVSQEREAKHDVIHATIEFFDAMIHASAVQEINWHMWLYYFSNFNEGMLGVYDLSNPELDLTAEYATRLEYLFYQLYRTMLSWIELGTHLPEKSIHAQPETPDCRRENGNIPKSAAICLVQCFKPFMTSRKLRPQFKKYIAEIVFRHLRGLRGHQAYYHVLSSCLLGRGDFRPNKEYGDEMVVAFAEIDHVIRFDLEEFEAELHAAFP